jgi:AraC family transcriptional regulator of adaptative response/methylated-DNA-[protein]-cysteine methyltransferase
VSDYERVERALRYLETNFKDQPGLAHVAAAAGLSEGHFQRLFRRWAGVSPKRFLQFVTAEYARERLRARRSVLDAALDAGLSGPGRLHDLTLSVHAMTPGEIGRAGDGLDIRHGVHDSPFGACFVAVTRRGVTAMSFAPGAFDELRARWPAARYVKDAAVARAIVSDVFAGRPLKRLLHVPGTNFQLRVWQALLEIPSGGMRSYGDIARGLGMPDAARAVGGAVAKNPVAYLIPCHRVIRESGAWDAYRWGPTRKRAMLGWEAALRT